MCRWISATGLVVGFSACAPAVTNNPSPAAQTSDVASAPDAASPPTDSSPPADPQPMTLPRGAVDGPIGTDHPIYVSAAADDGRWMVACQARVDTDGDGRVSVKPDNFDWAGDVLEPYLVLGSGKGMALPGVGTTRGMLVSPGGHFIAFAHERGVAVLDTGAATVRGLPRLATTKPTLLAFSPDDRYLVGRFEGTDGPTLQVHGLADGTEWDVRLGPGEPGELWFDAGSANAWVDVSRDDTDGNGRIDATRGGSALRHPCSRPAIIGLVVSPVDEPVEHRVPLIPEAAAVAAPGALMLLGGDVVARTPDGALERRSASSSEVIADAACDPWIVWVSPTADALVYRCYATGALTKIDVAGKRTPMGRSKQAGAENVRAGPEWLLLDQATAWRPADGRRVELGAFRRVAFTSHTGAVVEQRGSWVHHRLDDPGGKHKLAPADAWRWFGPVQGRFVLYDDTVVRVFDAGTGEETGRIEGRFWSLRTDGHVLVGPPAEDEALPVGPLRWVEPVALPR